MEQNGEQNGFVYTYSAKERDEIARIREKYTSPAERKESSIERVRRLDRRVISRAQTVSLTLGILGVLILGFGMSIVMTDFGVYLGIFADTAMLWGIAIGLFGGVIASLAYPVYQWVVRRERKKIAPEILRLTDELMK